MEQPNEKSFKARNYNAKLFPIYKMFSWDLLFYYSIIFLFLTQAKGLSVSNVFFGDSFYYIFKVIFQIPCVNVVEFVGKRKALILGNIFVSFSILALIIGNGLSALITCNFFMAIGFSIKAICEPALLNECVAFKEKSSAIFSSIDSRGSSLYYFLDAITAICCGFLFVFNDYLPMFICFGFTIFSIILSHKFLNYETSTSKSKLKKEGNFKVYFSDLRIAFRNIIKSNRLKALLLFSGLFYAVLIIRNTISNSLLVEIGVKEEYFGIISFFLTIVAAISSKNQNFFHTRLKNKVLSYFSLTYSIGMIIAGISALVIQNYNILFFIVIGVYVIWNAIRGPYFTLQKRYLNSFSTPSMSSKIYSACTLIESLFTTVVYWISSFLLSHMSTSFALVILGCIFTIAFVLILDYMKERIGLKPEEYKKNDIYFTEVH